MRRVVIGYVVFSAGMACRSGKPEEGSQGRAVTAQWSVDAVPVVDIAGTAANGDLVFEYASGATRLPNGSIIIGDGTGASVRFFDASGQPTRTVGREGAGPGEFRRVSWLGRCGADSVFVWDAMQNRMTVVDAASDVVRHYRVPADPTAGSPPATIQCSRTGVFAVHAFPLGMRPPSPTGESPHYKAVLSLADADGRISQALGEVAIMESRPLGKVTSIAMSADRLYVGTADSAFVDVLTLDGRYVTALPIHVPARSPTRRHYERAIEAQVIWLADRDERAAWKQRLLEIPMPEHVPAYAGLFTDSDGSLWVLLSLPGDSETWLRAIAPDGRVIADVYLPVDLRVFEVDRDYILGAYEEESGEPHVAMYRLHRGS